MIVSENTIGALDTTQTPTFQNITNTRDAWNSYCDFDNTQFSAPVRPWKLFLYTWNL